MTYLSDPDRRAETEPAEERRVELSFVEVYGRSPCPWCGQPTRKHGPEALTRCEAAFQARMDRRLAGPVRVRDFREARP